MAVTQYIGARYVPIIADPIEWSNTNAYEPLTIVTHQGNSYTSRQYVPAGIDIQNDDYWALTGNYNAQIEQYRQEVTVFADDIEDIQNEIGEGFNSENTVANAISTIANAISTEATNRENGDTAITNIIGTGFSTSYTVADTISDIRTGSANTKIITVEDYGAKGDGVTDSTQAIQNAIAENPNSIIAFRGGTYLVSDTVHCWGNRGGQEIDLGGSFFIWSGSNQGIEMFSIDRTDSLEEGDYLYPYYRELNPMESECKIVNGTIRAGGCGIFARAFHTIIDNVKILDASQAAIKIGDPTTHISMQAKITDIHIMRSANYSEYWSEQASAINASLDDVACGIEVYDPDCNFSDINVNRYSVSIRIHAGGHTFENCHFTCQYKEPRNTMPNTAAVVFTLYTATSIYTNMFDTCYFDNPKYCIWSNEPIRQVVLVSDGMYFNSGTQIVSTVQSYEAYMAKNISEIKVDNFNVVPADGRCVFIPAKMLIAGSNFQGLGLCQEHYVQNIYNGTENGHRFWSANQNFDDGEYVNVVRPANSMSNGDDQCIGCFVLPGTTMSRFNDIEIRISDRAYLYYSAFIHYNGTTLVLTDETTRGTSRGRYDLKVGQAREISFDGNTNTVWPIYIHANQDFSSTPIYMSLNTNNSNMIGFLNEGGFRDFNYAHGTWVIEKSFS